MKQKEFFLTSEGYLELETELNYLKTDKRNEVLNSLKEARALGDLSENAEYDSAREEQGKLEARIKEVEYILEHATIIDDAQTEKDKVTIGSTVSLQYDGDDEVEEYRIVGSQEADPFNNKISNESPIAMAILGKKVGDMAEVDSPNGTYKVKIVKVA
ncbi:MAG TPA: transcription elongation factor GreA [Firmicutes bacterium]|jgi:transcription elongation factor GreA|nr:transcription elongation factor GreA [Bacillota bacterium]